MLGWIFKSRKGAASAPVATPSAPSAAAPASPPAVDHGAQLDAARGDDHALLELLRQSGVPLPIKLAAVEALDGETALQQAERELRSRDRRVHQLSKQRLRSKSAARKSREEAARLLGTARELAAAEQVGINRIVELDRAWQALDASAIDSADREEFTALTTSLAARIRERADLELQRQRWRADAEEALRQLQSACAAAAEGTLERDALAAAIAAARGVDGRSAGADTADSHSPQLADLRQAIDRAHALDGHLAVLERLLSTPAYPAGTQEPAQPSDEQDAVPVEDDPEQQWQALAPLPDARWTAMLQARHAQWRLARDAAQRVRQAKRTEQHREQPGERRREPPRERSAAQLAAVDEAISRIEQALEDGHLADAQRGLSRVDDELKGSDAPAPLRSRLQAARAGLAQLRGWQQWAGSHARDELVLQAEALAAATIGRAAAPEDRVKTNGSEAAEAGGDVVSDAERDAGAAGESADASARAISDAAADVARLSLRQRADIIDTLRARWKEIDRHGQPASQALWRRFDSALKTAYEPVAAQAAAQRAARQANLQARLQLLEGLEAMGSPTADASDEAITAPVDAAPPVDGADARPEPPSTRLASGDPRMLAEALSGFHAEWRKLGPIQHTVPRAEQAALNERLQAAVDRLEAPLQAARLRARSDRGALVARARALADEVPSRGRDAVAEVRALQSEWQQLARAVPLARADEQALWTEFKAATDAVFAARQASFDARDAALDVHAAERVALIERLREHPGETLAAQRRTLAEVDAAWQRSGPAPRASAAELDAQFRAAREAVVQAIDRAADREWQAVCDALGAKLALCAAREQGDATGGGQDAAVDDFEALAASWRALPVLPAPLENALRRRVGLSSVTDAGGPLSVDDLLLQIETAWNLPTPPAFESARRERKLLAMKAALEGRRPTVSEPPNPLDALAGVLGCRELDAVQQERLAAVLAWWRQHGAPGQRTGAR